MGRSQLRNALQQIIAAENPFEGELRMQFLIARRGILNRGDNWLQLLFRLLELLMELDDLLKRRDLLFRLPRLIERRNQLVRVRDSFVLADFVVMDIEGDLGIELILGRPFLRAARARIEVGRGEICFRIGKEDMFFRFKQREE